MSRKNDDKRKIWSFCWGINSIVNNLRYPHGGNKTIGENFVNEKQRQVKIAEEHQHIWINDDDK